MKRKLIIVFLLIMACVMLAADGCDRKVAFFYGDKPEFQKGPAGAINHVYTAPGADFKKYKMVFFDRVEFDLTPDKGSRVPDASIKHLRDDFREIFSKVIGDVYPVAREPRPDALKIRIFISGRVASLPVPSARDGIEDLISASSATMQVALIDPVSGKRLGAAEDTNMARNVVYRGDAKKWARSRRSLRYWSKQLLPWLEALMKQE